MEQPAPRLEASAPWQERAAYGALIIFLALVYLSPGTLHPALENVPIAKATAILSFLFLFLAKRVTGEPWRLTDKTSLSLIAFTLVSAVSIIDALWKVYALFVFLNATKMVAVYFLITQLVTTRQRVRQVLWTLLLTAIVPAAGTLTHYILRIDLVEGYRATWIGIFADPNDMAYNLVVLIPIALALVQTESSFFLKGILISELLLFLAAIYVTSSRGGLVGLLVIGFFLVLKSRHRMFSFVAGGMLLVFLLPLAPAKIWERAETILKFRQDESAMGRIYAWRAGMAMVADRPLLGVGVGCFVMGWPIYAPPEAGTKWRAPHNTFVEVLGENGILGGLAFFTFIGTTMVGLQKLTRRKNDAASPLIQADRSAPKGWIGASIVKEKQAPEDCYARGVEVALWGFLACSLTLGVVRSWPPFILVGLAVALQMMWKAREGEDEGRPLIEATEPAGSGQTGLRSRTFGLFGELRL